METMNEKRERLAAARRKIVKVHGGRRAAQVVNKTLNFLERVLTSSDGNVSDKFKAAELSARIYEMDSRNFIERHRAAVEIVQQEKSAAKFDAKAENALHARLTAEQRKEAKAAEKNQNLAEALARLKGE